MYVAYFCVCLFCVGEQGVEVLLAVVHGGISKGGKAAHFPAATVIRLIIYLPL